MNIDFIAERTLRNTSRLVNQGMWLLFLVAAALMMILRRSASARTGSLWVLAAAVLAFMASFALRDLLRKVGHRNTENKIVSDVKSFLEREPVTLIERPIQVKAEASPAAVPVGDAFVPSESADFIPLKGAATLGTPDAEPVVFDAFPSREHVTLKMDFYAVLLPVRPGC